MEEYWSLIADGVTVHRWFLHAEPTVERYVDSLASSSVEDGMTSHEIRWFRDYLQTARGWFDPRPTLAQQQAAPDVLGNRDTIASRSVCALLRDAGLEPLVGVAIRGLILCEPDYDRTRMQLPLTAVVPYSISDIQMAVEVLSYASHNLLYWLLSWQDNRPLERLVDFPTQRIGDQTCSPFDLLHDTLTFGLQERLLWNHRDGQSRRLYEVATSALALRLEPTYSLLRSLEDLVAWDLVVGTVPGPLRFEKFLAGLGPGQS